MLHYRLNWTSRFGLETKNLKEDYYQKDFKIFTNENSLNRCYNNCYKQAKKLLLTILLKKDKKMEMKLISRLRERYEILMRDLDINDNGILGKISNPRYKDHKLRLSGFPYVGSKYSFAKKKILFVGLDIGIDECREDNTFHDFDSRRICIAGSVEGCTTLGYNDHISGTYTMALFLLQKYYSWEDEWNELLSFQDITSKTAIYRLQNSLPIEVLDYISFTNIHKFVSVCRGCNIDKDKPKCLNQECLEEKKNVNRSGGDNRKWYNKQEEIKMLLDEINILEPELVFFQGSAVKLDNNVINEINSFCDICLAYHPSAWNVGANKAHYANKINIRQKIKN